MNVVWGGVFGLEVGDSEGSGRCWKIGLDTFGRDAPSPKREIERRAKFLWAYISILRVL